MSPAPEPLPLEPNAADWPVPAPQSARARVVGRLWRRRTAYVLLLFVVAMGAGALRYRVTRPDYRLNRGEAAVRAEDWDEAEDYARRLERSGYPDHAHLLRAQSFYSRKRPDL